MARRTRTTRTTARPKATISRGKKRRFTAKQKTAIAAAIGTLAAAGVTAAAAKRYFKAAGPYTYDELAQLPANAAKQQHASSVQAQASGIQDETEVPSPAASTAKRKENNKANRAAAMAANALEVKAQLAREGKEKRAIQRCASATKISRKNKTPDRAKAFCRRVGDDPRCQPNATTNPHHCVWKNN